MRLTSGSLVGPYTIEALVGAGGMGEVYRALDSRLGRAVAVKLLPALFATDPERLARFEREARTLASLNHPNIAQVYGFEELDGVRALVMELVDGPTLAEVIATGSTSDFESRTASAAGPHPMPLLRALAIARQIALALDAAHEKGIVHRDLKPANIKLTPDGTVKVLDFGLAKLHAGADAGGSGASQLANSPTIASPAVTAAGILLGTASYMAPEQARGLPVDKRADIWAFGLVVYEMLTGRQAFGGETVSDAIAAVLRAEPDWSALPPDTPGWLRRLLRHLLDRDPRHRLRDIGDAIVEIDEMQLEAPAASAPPPVRRGWLTYAVIAAALLLAGIAGFLFGRRPAAEATLMVDAFLGTGSLFAGVGPAFDLTPDGRHLVYVVNAGSNGRELWVRGMDGLTVRKLAEGPRTGASPYHPFVSPDGAWVGYVTPTELRKVPIDGGSSFTLAAVALSRGATWAGADTIVFAPSMNGGLVRIPGAGGTPEPVTELVSSAGEASHRWPDALPDGHTVVFASHTRATDEFERAVIEAVDLRTRARKVLLRGGTAPRYAPSGHLVYVRDGVLYAAPFDATRVEVTGGAVPVVQDVRWDRNQGGAQVAFSDTGVLAYVRGAMQMPVFPIVWVNRDGETTPLDVAPGTYANPRLSPDGRFLALTVWTDGNWDIWLYDLQREVLTRLTFHPGADSDQIWSPDGQFLIFSSDRNGRDQLFRKRWDGSAEEELFAAPNAELYASSWSASGIVLAHTGLESDIVTLSIGDRTIRPLLKSPYKEQQAVFSPDDRWVAYTSHASGRPEVYVRAFESEGRWQVSDAGGSQPRWSRDGRQLFYRTDDGVMAADVEVVGNGLRTGRAQPVVRGSHQGGLTGIGLGSLVFADYDVSVDGRRFVMFPRADADGGGGPAVVTLVTGWFDSLKRTARSGR